MESKGFANLRFAALCNIPPGTPFFPASYHQGPASFALGLENSDLVYQAFSDCSNLVEAKQALTTIIGKEYTGIEKMARDIRQDLGIEYAGLDGSICSSIKSDESIAYAFEHLQLGRFGDVGSCAIASIITDVIQHVPVKQVGYSGLMLPVLEDHGLSKRNVEHSFDIQSLLLYSSVCGTGLDTIPLPGDIHKERLIGILLDVASLSQRLQKPLSARLIPIPGKKAGERTEFTFEYFVNSIVMKP